MDAQLSASIRSLVSDVAANESEVLTLRAENTSLKDRLQVMKTENSALHTDIDGKTKALQALTIELNNLNKQRLEYIDGVRQHFSVQADIVDLKYEVLFFPDKMRMYLIKRSILSSTDALYNRWKF